jgi:predicted O-methyltransferase YrrM
MQLSSPQFDPTGFLDDFRAAHLSQLLVAAVSDFDVGRILSDGPISFAELRGELKLAERPAIVLLTALRALKLIDVNDQHQMELTAYGREKLSPESPFHLRGYVGLGAFSADVRHIVECLKHDRSAGPVSFVFHSGGSSALDDPQTAGVLTRAMADRARSIAPLLAQEIDLSSARRLVDVGGGHGLYSAAFLKRNPSLKAMIIDRAPALEVARQFAAELDLGGRMQFVVGDVHTLGLEERPDAVLIANLLHDYNSQDAEALVHRFAAMLAPGGRMLVLDAWLNSVNPGDPPVSDGPRAVAAYSGLLFSLCEGRCYRLDEVQTWLHNAGLRVGEQVTALPAHGGVVIGHKEV